MEFIDHLEIFYWEECEGYGLRTTKTIRKGEVILLEPVIELPNMAIENNILQDYVFEDGVNEYISYLVHKGCYLNETREVPPNAEHGFRYDERTERSIFELTATADIEKGQQIFIEY